MSTPNTDMSVPKKRRGFAAMDPAKVKEIASKGGKAAHVAGTAHTFTTEEARAAGKKGGVAPHVRRGRQKLPDDPGQPGFDGPTPTTLAGKKPDESPEPGTLVGPDASRG